MPIRSHARRVFTGCAALAVAAAVAVPAPSAAFAADDHSALAGITNIVVIYEENHSFDNLFGRWEGVNGLSKAAPDHTVQVGQDGKPLACLPQNDVNLPPIKTDCTGGVFPNRPFGIEDYIKPEDTTCPVLNGPYKPNGWLNGTGTPGGCTEDLVHRFYQEQYQINGGRQNRYVTGSDAIGLTMGHYGTTSLPIYRYLHGPDAPHYAIADNFFQAAFGGSFLNHQWLIGFLGSGKTTLIRALLETPEGADTAVVVNEYGEVGIDDALLRGSSDATVLLGNGCVCCLMRSDLQETLRTLFAERSRGAVPSFQRVIIETSGLADPGPVLQTFASDRALGAEFHLQSLVGVIDAVSGPGNLARMPEARHQIALADRIVVTKPDLAPAPAVEALVGQLHALSTAPVAIARDGNLDPAFVLDESFGDDGHPARGPGYDRGHDHDHSHDHDHHEHEHADGIGSFTVFFDRPLVWPAFEQAMAVLTALRGPDLLRVKGLVAVEGCRGPVVVHAVQHTAHRPVELETWPTEDRRSRLVFITRRIGRTEVEGLFAAVAAIATPTAA